MIDAPTAVAFGNIIVPLVYAFLLLKLIFPELDGEAN